MVTQVSERLNQARKISVVLTFLSCSIIFIVGFALLNTNHDIKILNLFLKKAENAQPSFEKSLIVYTEKTKDTIEFLLSLRPSTKEEFVKFISEIENIGQELKLNLDLQSSKTSNDNQAEGSENTLNYNIKFYGSIDDLNVFLRKIEELQYYIKVDEIKYKNTQYLSEEEKETPNINLKIKLYIK